MNFSRLITFGCSLTFGWSLSDNHPNNEFPSKHAWPVHLSKLLNISLDNQGIGGASNKQILYNILNYKFNNDDIVFVLWSHYNRHCIITDHNNIEQLGIWKKHDKKTRAFFKTLWNTYNQQIENHFFQNLAYFYLQQNNIKHVFLTSKRKNIDLTLEWNSTKFLNVFFDDIRVQFPLAKDKSHPGQKAHSNFAQAVYDKYIIDEYYTGDNQ